MTDRDKSLQRDLLSVLANAGANGPDGCHALANALLDGATALLQDPRESKQTAEGLRLIAGYLTQLAGAPVHQVQAVRRSFHRLVVM